MKGFNWRKIHAFRQDVHNFRLQGKMFMDIDNIPLTYEEFNQLYFARRPVVVRYPKEMAKGTDKLAAFYAALRMTNRHKVVGQITSTVTRDVGHAIWNDQIYLAMNKNPTPKTDRIFLEYFLTYDSGVYECGSLPVKVDDWVMMAEYDADRNGAERIVKLTKMYDGFSHMKGKKVVIFIDDRFEDEYNQLKSEFGKRFLFIEYGREKEIVDKWFRDGNLTLISPMFDILISEPGIDRRILYLYLAANHYHELYQYCDEIGMEDVEKHLSPLEIYSCELPWWKFGKCNHET